MSCDFHDMETNLQIGEAIRRNRQRLGLSRLRFSAVVGFHRNQLKKYEEGVASVPAERLVLMADALDMSVEEFISAAEVDPDELRLLRLFRRIGDQEGRERVIEMAADMARPVVEPNGSKTKPSE